MQVWQGFRRLSEPFIAGHQFVGTEDWTGSSWHWALISHDSNGVIYDPIIRYRIRKPRALLNLIERAKELDDAPEGPLRVKPRVNA